MLKNFYLDTRNVSGIYAIRHKNSGKVYVGSSVNIHVRWKQHKSSLKHRRHHCVRLQRAWNKYGEEAFEFFILEKVDEDLRQIEQNYIDKLNASNSEFGYNSKVLATFAPYRSRIISQKVLQKKKLRVLPRRKKVSSVNIVSKVPSSLLLVYEQLHPKLQKKRITTSSLPMTTYIDLTKASIATGESLGAIVRIAIDEYCDLYFQEHLTEMRIQAAAAGKELEVYLAEQITATLTEKNPE